MIPLIVKGAQMMRSRRQGAPTSGTSPIVTLAFLGVGTFVFIKYVNPWFKEMAAKKQLSKDQGSTVTVKPGKKLFDLMGRPIKSANLATIAADLYDSLSFPTDNERVVRVFQTTPYGYVKALEDFYLDKYKEDLRTTMVKKLKDKYWIAIKYNFR